MGNMVLIAVKHNAVRDTSKRRFELLDVMMHDFETSCPKFFDGRHSQSYMKECYADDAIMSRYYHASDHVNLLISNTMAAYLPSFIGSDDFLSRNDSWVKQRVLRQVKESMGWDKRPPIQTRAIRKEKLKTVDDGDDVALFGILTDYWSRINGETALEALYSTIAELPWLENGKAVMANQYNSRFDGLRFTPFVGIGNIKASQLAMVLMSGNIFYARAMPNHGINYGRINDLIAQGDPEGNILRINHYPSLLEGLGYSVKEQDIALEA